ncbi:helix-turn-helix transcriptional regulator [Haloarchaeobius salinus]|uniref:helix-turn-helix transcriptional regulator n=1 Tax=Haloarchaeobius salinus TaxID=1198298 RepID=UPI0021098B73|nr:helix-turn-helix domain-containing protein [Haloarchaeobius salinus]
MRRLLGVGALVLLAVGAVVLAGGATAAAPGPDGSVHTPPNSTDTLGSAQEFDRTQFRIRVFENGSARFAIRYERQLSNESEREQFQQFATEFESNETELYTNFERRARDLVAFGRNETGREMTATGFQRSATEEPSFDGHVGIVTMSFRWTAFAQTADDRVVVADVFEGGFYIGPAQSLVFLPGDGLVFESVSPAGEFSAPTPAESDTVTWQGERSFSDQRPRVVYVPSTTPTTSATTTNTDGGGGGTTATETTTSGPGDSTATSPEGGGSDGSLPMLPIMLGLVLVGLAGAVVWFSRRSEDDDTGTAATDSPSDGGDGGAAATESPAVEPSVPDEELLTDEDRVVDLLEENGGRMRQSNIVDETDWSKSKVSMLLSDMEDDGSISKLRVGRENIVSLAGHEPDAVGSPFDDEQDDGR